MNVSLYVHLKDDVFNLDDRIRYFGFMDNRRGMVMSELRDPNDSHPGETQLVHDTSLSSKERWPRGQSTLDTSSMPS